MDARHLKILFNTCTKCNIELNINQFDVNLRNSHGYDYWCRPCRRNYTNKHYYDNLDKSRKRTNGYRAARVEWLSSLKNNKPCKDCGKIYESFCMDFDHLYGKLKSISRMVLDNTPINIILQEIKKCDLVCILCHNSRTISRLNDKSGKKKYNKYVIRNIEIINNAKNKPCEICNVQYAVYNMQLDHIDPATKFKDICKLKNYAVQTLLTEIDKCQVLCALCHRRKSIFEQRADFYKIRPKNIRKKLFIDDISKECVKCHQILSFDKFNKHPKTKSGYNSWCKECLNAYKRQRRQQI